MEKETPQQVLRESWERMKEYCRRQNAPEPRYIDRNLVRADMAAYGVDGEPGGGVRFSARTDYKALRVEGITFDLDPEVWRGTAAHEVAHYIQLLNSPHFWILTCKLLDANKISPRQDWKELIDFSEVVLETGAWYASLSMTGGKVFDILYKKYGEPVERRGETVHGMLAVDAKLGGTSLKQALDPEKMGDSLLELGLLNNTGNRCRTLFNSLLEAERAKGDIEIVFGKEGVVGSG